MPLEIFLNLSEENIIIHELLTDEEILKMVEEEEEEKEEEEKEEEEEGDLYSDLIEEEKLVVLAKVVAILEAENDCKQSDVAVTVMRRIQRKIRWSIADEKAKEKVQRCITDFF